VREGDHLVRELAIRHRIKRLLLSVESFEDDKCVLSVDVVSVKPECLNRQ